MATKLPTGASKVYSLFRTPGSSPDLSTKCVYSGFRLFQTLPFLESLWDAGYMAKLD